MPENMYENFFNARILHDNCPKNIFLDFFGGEEARPSMHPVSYAYAYNFIQIVIGVAIIIEDCFPKGGKYSPRPGNTCMSKGDGRGKYVVNIFPCQKGLHYVVHEQFFMLKRVLVGCGRPNSLLVPLRVGG